MNRKSGGILIFLWLLAGCSSSTTSSTTVSANAGSDQQVVTGTTATLDGQSSTGVTSAAWTFSSKPSGSSASLANSSTLTPSFTADVAGSYVVQLAINDSASTDTVTVTAQATVSAISVGSGVATRERFNTTEYVVSAGETATLSGASSAAALKTKAAAVSGYSWEQISGPGATVVGNTTSETLQFVAPGYAGIQNLNPADNYKWQILPISRDDTKMVFRLTTTGSNAATDVSTFTLYLQDSDGSEIHTSSGLPNVAIGALVVLSGPDLLASGASATDATKTNGSAVTDWSWTLTPPSGSSATFEDTGTTTSAVQFPKFVADVEGIYAVAYSSTTGTNTYTAATTKCPGTLTINVADWVGVGTVGGTTPTAPQCATCHGVSDISGLGDTVTPWSATVHAKIFENNMSTYQGLAPEPYLWEFHTVGYNKDVINNGFDDLASDNNFTFPSAGLTYAAFTSQDPAVAKLANVQCENCHGPGSQHDGDPLRIGVSFAQAGTCGQCHIQETEWENSGHNFVGVEHGSGNYQSSWVSSPGCLRCHNSKGFTTYLESGRSAETSLVSDASADFPGVTCAACHDPHDVTNESQLRQKGNVTMAIDGSTVDAGKAAVCYTCHDGNYAKGETNCDVNGDGLANSSDSSTTLGITSGVCGSLYGTAVGYWRGGMHYAEAAPMLEGNLMIKDLDNDATDDLTLDENSFHSSDAFTLAGVTGNTSLPSENNKCVTCHMAAGPSAEEAGYGHLGGHTFKVVSGHGIGHLLGTDEGDEQAGEAGDIELVSACQTCHASVTEINRLARADYDGDGVREGIQDEVSGLVFALWKLIKVVDTANGGNLNQTATTYNTTVGPASSDDTPGGTITVNTINWKGDCASFSGTTGAACGKSITGTGKCTNVAQNKTKDDYQQCNFMEAPAYLRAAIWNLKSVIQDGSLGIHNAAYVVQTLQETYKAVGRKAALTKNGTAATSSFTYQTDYSSATLR